MTHFGDCKSKLIFEEAKKQADEKYKAEEGDGFFGRLGKGIAKTVTKAVIDTKEIFASNKCELDTPLPWIFTSRDHMIDGAPALTAESQCPCKLGGLSASFCRKRKQQWKRNQQWKRKNSDRRW
ncbi:PAAR-like protein [Anaerocolumna jejuensis]|uniref:PAAR-like protein n=1 Tax=Anaerocolumna jejuensis TaxID=259063 RepID=UPI003F7BDD4E